MRSGLCAAMVFGATSEKIRKTSVKTNGAAASPVSPNSSNPTSGRGGGAEVVDEDVADQDRRRAGDRGASAGGSLCARRGGLP